MPQLYRQLLLTELTSDLAALTHNDGTSLLFGTTGSFYIEIPDAQPVCEILPIDLNNEIDGLPEDHRAYGYTIMVYEMIGASPSNSDALLHLRRLMDIEDMLLRYFTKIPSNLEYAVAGVHVFRVDVRSGRYDLRSTNEGIAISYQLDINLMVQVNTLLE